MLRRKTYQCRAQNILHELRNSENKMRSKHKKAQYFAKTGLFTDLKSFVEFENRIAKLPEYDRGNAFEVFAEAYFNTLAIIPAQEVWPDNAIPQSIRSPFGLLLRDMGIDEIIKTHYGDEESTVFHPKRHFIQFNRKNKNGIS